MISANSIGCITLARARGDIKISDAYGKTRTPERRQRLYTAHAAPRMPT